MKPFMHRLLRAGMAATLLGVATSIAAQTTHRAAPGEDLQARIDAASRGDTVRLAPGAYPAIAVRTGIELHGPTDQSAVVGGIALEDGASGFHVHHLTVHAPDRIAIGLLENRPPVHNVRIEHVNITAARYGIWSNGDNWYVGHVHMSGFATREGDFEGDAVRPFGRNHLFEWITIVAPRWQDVCPPGTERYDGALCAHWDAFQGFDNNYNQHVIGHTFRHIFTMGAQQAAHFVSNREENGRRFVRDLTFESCVAVTGVHGDDNLPGMQGWKTRRVPNVTMRDCAVVLVKGALGYRVNGPNGRIVNSFADGVGTFAQTADDTEVIGSRKVAALDPANPLGPDGIPRTADDGWLPKERGIGPQYQSILGNNEAPAPPRVPVAELLRLHLPNGLPPGTYSLGFQKIPDTP